MMLSSRVPGLTTIIVLAGSLANPDAFRQLSDVKGSKDHPMISRYTGSVIIGYDFRKFDTFVLATGPFAPLPRKPGTAVRVEPTKSLRVEGAATRILYVAPAERSSLEILRNYQLELKKNGFEILFECEAAQCGGQDGWLGEYYLYSMDKRLRDTPAPGAPGPTGQISEYALSRPLEQRYLTAKRAKAEGDVYVSVYVAMNRARLHKETLDRPIVLLDVVETVPMEGGMVTVDAASMAKDISSMGRVALYGILFDTDKADIKPESQPTLQEIAKLLKQDPALKLHVVGHTDNVGAFDYNLGLSERRAGSVVKWLSGQGIAAARLRAAGVGMLSPVASNDTEQGRAKNRRVELVKQ